MSQLVYSGFVKLLVSIMNPVPYAKPTIAGVKLEVMEVVELRGEVKREVVTTVVVHHLQMKMQQGVGLFEPEVESCRTKAKQPARELP